MEIKVLSVDELKKITKLKTKDRFSIIYKNFHYFSHYDFIDDNYEFIIALEGNNILGVLKFSLEIYNNIFSENGLKENDLYTLMRYIDVNDNYKSQRIGTRLIQKLNEIIDKSIPILISEEDGDGIKVGSHKMFIKNLTNVNIILKNSSLNNYLQITKSVI